MAISAFACWSRPALTTWGMRPVDAGTKKADAAPCRAAAITMCHTWAEPLKSRMASHDLDHGPHRVAGEHDQVARQAVGPYPAGEQEYDVGQGVGREDDPDLGRRSPDLENGERDCDERQAVTNGRAALAQPQEPEVPFLECCEVGPETAKGAAHGPRILEVGYAIAAGVGAESRSARRRRLRRVSPRARGRPTRPRPRRCTPGCSRRPTRRCRHPRRGSDCPPGAVARHRGRPGSLRSSGPR